MGQSWSFTGKLAAGFAAMVVLTTLLAAIAVNALNDVSDGLETVSDQQLPHAVQAVRLEAQAERVNASFRGYLLSGQQRSLDGWTNARDELGKSVESLRASRQTSATGRAALDEVSTAAAAYDRAAEALAESSRAGEPPSAIETKFENDVLPLARTLRQRIEAYEDLTNREMSDASADAVASGRRSLVVASAITAAIIAFCIAIAIALTRGLSRQVGAAVHQIESASTELQTAANQQSAGIKEQSTALAEITTTLSELLSTSRQIATSSQSVARIAGDTSQASADGEAGMTRATEGVEGIRTEVDRIVEHMLELGKKSQQIGGIVDLINELAEQTNILAINATIEAAGAGEQGVRFGAVAEEIRKLAGRVGLATKDIRSLVEQVRSAVSATVMATETGSKTVDAGQAQIREVAQHFGRIAGLVETTTEAAREIELSTKQQATAVEQVNSAITNVSQAAQETSASASQTLQTARELVTLSGELARLVRAGRQA